ncbi:MAG: hypothetical protein IIB75_01620 [Proteobacteria bacterium]|nr:hypothetical protein [Pseudomonadota bacterium]
MTTALDERAAARTPASIDRYYSYDQEIRGIELNLWKKFSGGTFSHRIGVGVEYRDRITTEFRDGLRKQASQILPDTA